jgi:hypothetical protein
MRLTTEQQSLLPTEADVCFYEEHGWHITPAILPDELIDAAIEGARRYYVGERDMPLPLRDGFSDWKPEDGNVMRNNEYVSLQNRELRRLVQYPMIGAVAARLSRSRIVRLFDDQLIYKPPSQDQALGVVGWHTDRGYWMTCASENMITAWVPFHDCDEVRGTLMVMDQSHKWPGTTGLRTFRNQNLRELKAKFTGGRSEVKTVPMNLKRGQVSFHHCRTIHGSDTNRSPLPRISLAIHIQDESNRYRVYRNEQGVPWQLPNDRMCRRSPDGMPDYSDPAIFPVLWEGTATGSRLNARA